MNRLTLIGLAGLLAIGTGVKLAQGKGKQAVVSPSLQPVRMQVQKASPTAQQPPTDPNPQPIAAAPKLLSITISTCNGEVGDANFRSVPSMANSAIVGVIESGQQVYLTGRIVEADGEVWHEAIALNLVADLRRAILANQHGWIASCFLTGR